MEPIEEVSNDEEVPYTFIIKTGSNVPIKEATKKWDDGTMILTINPGSSSTASQDLRVAENFNDKTEGAVTVDFWLPRRIGVPKLLKVDLESDKFELFDKDPLYVREITIIYDRNPYRFPIKNFIYPHHPIHNPTEPREGCVPHFLIREGAGTLKHHETEDYVIKAREEDLKNTKSMVNWKESKDVVGDLLYPGLVDITEYDKLPRFLQFKEANYDMILDFTEKGRDEVKSNVFDNLRAKLFGTYEENRFASFEEFELYLRHKSTEMGWQKESISEAMKVAKIFHKDEEFGRQMLCGPNAQQIKKVTSLDGRWAGCAVPEYAIEGKALQDVMEEGKLFQVTTDELDGIPHGGSFSKKLTGTKQTWYTVLADCLLYLRNDEKLVPVLIRLENRNDGKPATWWTPPEPGMADFDHPKYLAWLYAKMWFRSADMNCYALCSHFAKCHAVSEAIAVAAYRNLPNAHPIFRILQPHILGIIPVNVNARAVLLSPKKNFFTLFLSAGGATIEIFNNFFKKFSYDDLVVPLDVEKRGVQDIPEYLYRDDMGSHWEIIHQYLKELVHLSYPSDDDVIEDEELQNFFKDVFDNGFRRFENGAGFPRSVSTREKLVEYLTAVVVNISVFHTAVNFQTFTYVPFQPNMPCCMSQPPPDQDTIITMELILDSLPLLEITFYAMNASNLLGTFSPIERFYLGDEGKNKLGMLGENMAVSPEQEACIRRMGERMRELKDKIDARNRGRYIKYDVLSPINTPITTQA
ncbi:hypothetical protein ACHWQZ_G011370 [Mnemiopsis leidyi]